MADLLDLFDDDEPAAPPAPPPAPSSVPRETSAQVKRAATAPRLAKDEPCGRPPNQGGHVCRVGGGDAYFSDDHGRSWFCTGHRPGDFFPSDREKGGEGAT